MNHMKSTTLRHILTACITMLMAACTEHIVDDDPFGFGTGDEDLVPVEFRLSEKVDFTRAVSSIVTFDANEKIRVCVSSDGGTSYGDYDYTTAGAGQTDVGLTTPATPPYFPPGSGTTVSAYAYYPSPAVQPDMYSTVNSTTVFTVADNQTTDAAYKASDLMYAADRTITKGSSTGTTLQMAHKMAQLHLNVTGVGLTVNRVLVNAKRSVTFTPSSGTTAVTGDASDIVAKAGPGDAFVCIPEQQISGVTIKIEAGDPGDASTTATFTFTSASNFTAGSSYPINLTINAGQLGATTTITDWNGAESMTFAPSGDLEIDIDANANLTYTGSEIRPAITVKKEGETVGSANYTVQYFNNINAGNATILVLGKTETDYEGSIAVASFTIQPKTLTAAMVADIASPTYTGTQQTPSVTVTDGSTLTLDTDYTVAYGTNVNVSTGGTVTLTGINNYTGEVVKPFSISPKDISSDVTFTTTQTSATYTGSTITASVSSATYNENNLVLGTDYVHDASSQQSATTPDTYNMVLNGIGNYTGTKSVEWTIGKAASSLSVTSPANRTLTLTQASPTATITVSRIGDGVISAVSSSEILSIENINQTTQVISVLAVWNGSATITISVEENANYLAATASINVDVSNFVAIPVDLGLSVLWANVNVGASLLSDYGQYFSWGDITGYYNSDNRPFPANSYIYNPLGDNSTFTKYNTTDGLTQLEVADDAATHIWGSPWRIPTKEEWDELYANCTFTKTDSPCTGFRVTSNKEGYTSNSIFLPSAGAIREESSGAGYGDYGRYYQGDRGYYWSSVRGSTASQAYYLYISYSTNYVNVTYSDRYRGYTIRPVQPRAQ